MPEFLLKLMLYQNYEKGGLVSISTTGNYIHPCPKNMEKIYAIYTKTKAYNDGDPWLKKTTVKK